MGVGYALGSAGSARRVAHGHGVIFIVRGVGESCGIGARQQGLVIREF